MIGFAGAILVAIGLVTLTVSLGIYLNDISMGGSPNPQALIGIGGSLVGVLLVVGCLHLLGYDEKYYFPKEYKDVERRCIGDK